MNPKVSEIGALSSRMKSGVAKLDEASQSVVRLKVPEDDVGSCAQLRKTLVLFGTLVGVDGGKRLPKCWLPFKLAWVRLG